MKPVIDRRRRPGRADDGAGARLLRPAVPVVRGGRRASRSDTKAGTVLTRTLEAFRRYGVADQVLAKALRVDEIGDVERATNTARPSVQHRRCSARTPAIRSSSTCRSTISSRSCMDALDERQPGALHLRHRLTIVPRRLDDGVVATLRDARRPARGRRLVPARLRRRAQHRARAARHSGRRARRSTSADLLVDVKVDLDVAEPARLPLSRLFRRSAGMDDPGAPAALLALPLSARARASPEPTRERIPRQGPALHRPGRPDSKSSTPSSIASITASRPSGGAAACS